MLKRVRVHRMTYPTLDAARAGVFEYTERFHNPRDSAKSRQARPEVLSPFTTVRDFGVEPQIGVERTEYLGAGPLVLQGAKEVDHLPKSAGQVLRRSGFNPPGNSVEAFGQQSTQ